LENWTFITNTKYKSSSTVNQSINHSINQLNFYSAPYKTGRRRLTM